MLGERRKRIVRVEEITTEGTSGESRSTRPEVQYSPNLSRGAAPPVWISCQTQTSSASRSSQLFLETLEVPNEDLRRDSVVYMQQLSNAGVEAENEFMSSLGITSLKAYNIILGHAHMLSWPPIRVAKPPSVSGDPSLPIRQPASASEWVWHAKSSLFYNGPNFGLYWTTMPRIVHSSHILAQESVPEWKRSLLSS